MLFQKSLIDDDEEETWYYFLMFTIALINIRCTSFCLEKCWNYQEQQAAQGKIGLVVLVSAL
jgi:hypothetical protein